MTRRPFIYLRYLLVGFWGLFTVSLTAWWIYFGLSQIDHLIELDGGAHTQLVRHQKMVLWEGSFLILFLVAGAAALAYYMYREVQQSRSIQNFFTAFTHELKTSLASVSLNAEVLGEDLRNSADATLLKRFLADVATLNLQLENSLWLADPGSTQLMAESIELGTALDQIAERFPELAIIRDGDAVIEGDSRALAVIFGNLFHNARVHGKAREIRILIAAAGPHNVKITVADNGTGFDGDRKLLGKRFHRHYPGSGSGIGLSLVHNLTSRMGCSFTITDATPGFTAVLTFRGALR